MFFLRHNGENFLIMLPHIPQISEYNKFSPFKTVSLAMTTFAQNGKLPSQRDTESVETPAEAFQQNFNNQYYDTISKMTSHMSNGERTIAIHAARYGYGPFAHLNFKNEPVNYPFGGEMQPGLFRNVQDRKIANPAPLGLCAFALTTFVLSLINLGTLSLSNASVVISLAFGYGGLVQILAGMWEMAIGNTFGATAFASYGGFWVSFAILLTPGGFDIMNTVSNAEGEAGLLHAFSLFFFGWFVFTTLLLVCTLKSTIAFFLLFFTLDLTFLFVGLAYLYNTGEAPHTHLLRAGGGFGILAAFASWYNAFAGLADDTNSFFVIPAVYFPWTGRKTKQEASNA